MAKLPTVMDLPGVRAEGSRPIGVIDTSGYARGAQVTYNGQVVDVAPFTSGETARLKLGQ